MAEFAGEFIPDHALHPGKFLREEIDAHGISVDELATRVDQPVRLIHALLNEQCPVTSDLAHAIEAVFGGGDPEFWLNLQSLHDQVIARRPTAEGAEAD